MTKSAASTEYSGPSPSGAAAASAGAEEATGGPGGAARGSAPGSAWRCCCDAAGASPAAGPLDESGMTAEDMLKARR